MASKFGPSACEGLFPVARAWVIPSTASASRTPSASVTLRRTILVLISVFPFSGIVVPGDICSSRPFGEWCFSAHPVSPSAIKLGMDKTLRIFHAHGTPEELVHKEHQGHYQDCANEARHDWVYPREKRRHPKGVREVVGARMEDRGDQYTAA